MPLLWSLKLPVFGLKGLKHFSKFRKSQWQFYWFNGCSLKLDFCQHTKSLPLYICEIIFTQKYNINDERTYQWILIQWAYKRNDVFKILEMNNHQGHFNLNMGEFQPCYTNWRFDDDYAYLFISWCCKIGVYYCIVNSLYNLNVWNITLNPTPLPAKLKLCTSKWIRSAKLDSASFCKNAVVWREAVVTLPSQATLKKKSVDGDISIDLFVVFSARICRSTKYSTTKYWSNSFGFVI